MARSWRRSRSRRRVGLSPSTALNILIQIKRRRCRGFRRSSRRGGAANSGGFLLLVSANRHSGSRGACGGGRGGTTRGGGRAIGSSQLSLVFKEQEEEEQEEEQEGGGGAVGNSSANDAMQAAADDEEEDVEGEVVTAAMEQLDVREEEEERGRRPSLRSSMKLPPAAEAPATEASATTCSCLSSLRSCPPYRSARSCAWRGRERAWAYWAWQPWLWPGDLERLCKLHFYSYSFLEREGTGSPAASTAATRAASTAATRSARRNPNSLPVIDEPSGPPEELVCPLTHELMVDPVMLLSSGQTYERAPLERWLATHDTDPMTGVQLTSPLTRRSRECARAVNVPQV